MRPERNLVGVLFEEISSALERGEQVKLSGLGHFQLGDKPQRPGRNPTTGEPVSIIPCRVVTFHAGKRLRILVETRQKRR